MRVEAPNKMLVEIEEGIARSTQEILERHIADPVARKILSRAVEDQVFRALLELEFNGCTNMLSAKVLQSDELIRLTKFKARATGFREMRCEAVEITEMGYARLWAEQEGLEDNRWLGFFRGSILGYACIDIGHGICATRSYVETALELRDYAILKRLVHINSGIRQFPNTQTAKSKVSDQERAAAAHWWSTLEGVERVASVIDLSQPEQE